MAVAAAARAAEAAGFRALVLPPAHGPARDAAREHAAVIRELQSLGQRSAVISGGETTVDVTHDGAIGGRNGEYLLALAVELGAGGVHALAADSDGIDGTGDNAGALLTPDTLIRAQGAGQDAARRLAEQRSYEFFAALGDLVVTGPTRTNVNDLRIALVG
jgi:glycerate 2-kinase